MWRKLKEWNHAHYDIVRTSLILVAHHWGIHRTFLNTRQIGREKVETGTKKIALSIEAYFTFHSRETVIVLPMPGYMKGIADRNEVERMLLSVDCFLWIFLPERLRWQTQRIICMDTSCCSSVTNKSCRLFYREEVQKQYRNVDESKYICKGRLWMVPMTWYCSQTGPNLSYGDIDDSLLTTLTAKFKIATISDPSICFTSSE